METSTKEELIHTCEMAHAAIDVLFARLITVDPTFFPSKSGQPWNALVKLDKVLKRNGVKS